VLEQQLSGSHETRNKLVNSLSSRIEGPAIFDDEVAPTTLDDASGRPQDGAHARSGASLVREHLARAADPDPRSRARWERKMVIRSVQRGTNPYSREPRAERIARTERQLVSKSGWLPTSTKKLVHLAHQIQGKTVSDALVQMRFSKKKMAQEVRYQIEQARDEAIVERGMGQGGMGGKAGSEPRDSNGKIIEVKSKDGKWVKIDDPTRMYVAEAYVNRGPLRGKLPDYRARGRMNLKKQRCTSKSLLPLSRHGRLLTRSQASRSYSRRKRHGFARLPSARPRSSARAPGCTSPTAR
jgi:ribosomal protein L22